MLGNYYGESKRERMPIDPVEPEIVEEVACVKHPTKEEVEKARMDRTCGMLYNEYTPDEVKADWLIRVYDAYLALREEVKRKGDLIKMQDGFIMDKSTLAADRSTEIQELQQKNALLIQTVEQLQADNEALTALLLDKQH